MNRTNRKFRVVTLLLLITGLTTPVIAQEDDVQRTVLITGANRGLGLEMVKQFKADGYKVIGTSRSPEKATELKATGAQLVKLDVTSKEDLKAMSETLKGVKIDILINNAGYFGPKLMTEKTATTANVTWDEMMDCFAVNAAAPLFVTQALLPNLHLSKQPKVINISSRSGIITNGVNGCNAIGYRVSKTALNRVTQLMAGDKSLKKFIIVSVAPGHNKTDMGTERGKLDPAVSMKKVKKLIEEMTKKHHGGFWYYDGKRVQW